MAIMKNGDKYQGILDLHEPNWPEVLIEHKSREVVAWKLRQEFADRLETVAHDAALLKHLLDGADWSWIEDPLIEARVPKLLASIADTLHTLRDNEPALMLCADREGQAKVTLDDGSQVAIDWGDWSESSMALHKRGARAAIDADLAFAATGAIDALAAAGIRGPRTAEIADMLAQSLRYDQICKLDEGTPTADHVAELAKAHVKVVVQLASTKQWADSERAYDDRGSGSHSNAPYWLTHEYKQQIKRELMTPEERADDDRSRRSAEKAARALMAVVPPSAAKSTRRPVKAAKTRRAA